MKQKENNFTGILFDNSTTSRKSALLFDIFSVFCQAMSRISDCYIQACRILAGGCVELVWSYVIH